MRSYMAGNLSIQGQQTAVAGGAVNIGPFSVPLSAIQQSQQITSSTTTTVTAPSGAAGVLIAPLNLTAGTITVKGVTGDTGVGVSNSQPTFMSVPARATSSIVV